MPKISVLMSVYNEPVDWMRQAIESILNQTYKDFEFIIVNDNPEREENQLVLNEYRDKDSRIIILCNEHNIGLTKSLNRGLTVANGEYIARMDADDISDPSRFHYQLRYLTEHPNITILGTSIFVFKSDSKWLRKKRILPLSALDIRLYAMFKNPIAHPSIMINLKNMGTFRYDEKCKRAQDYNLWVRLMLAGKDIENLKMKLLSYRNVQKGNTYFCEQNSVADIARLSILEYEFGEKFVEEHKRIHLYVCSGISDQRFTISEIEQYLLLIKRLLLGKYPNEKFYIEKVIGELWENNCSRQKKYLSYFCSILVKNSTFIGKAKMLVRLFCNMI